MSNEPNIKNELQRVLKFVKGLGFFGIIIILGLYLATGIYTVGPDEEGTVLTFGKYSRSTKSGVHWRMPSPIEEVIKVKVTKVNRLEIGFRTINSQSNSAQYKTVEEEALMLTGDENILFVNAIVQYKIKNVKEYLFNLKNPVKMIKDTSEASLREVVGKAMKLDEILTTGKGVIQEKTKIKLQKLLDKYKSGIFVMNVQLQDVQPPKQVSAAFKDVASAKEDKIRYINEANGYKNDIIPKARGKAMEEINDATAYKEKRTKEAQGDVARFLALSKKYKLGKEVTRTRLYLETLEEVMPNIDKVLVDKELQNSVLNILNGEGVAK